MEEFQRALETIRQADEFDGRGELKLSRIFDNKNARAWFRQKKKRINQT